MERSRKLLLLVVAFSLLMTQSAPILIATSWLHMVMVLATAKRQGVYPTAADGMRARVAESWLDVENVEIVRAGPASFSGSDPHVWFVVAKVWAAKRGGGKPIGQRGFDLGGSYFLHVQDGWVHVAEGSFPPLVGLCMRLFNYWG